MWIAFDKETSAVIARVNYGSPARQGATDSFSIFAYFEDLEVNATDYVATISFKRPDGSVIRTTYFMDFDTQVFRENQASPINNSALYFVNNQEYSGFVFTPQDPAILGMAGKYQATIVLSHNNELTVNGTFEFFVENTAYQDTYEISASQWDELLRAFPLVADMTNKVINVVSFDTDEYLRERHLSAGNIVFYTVDNTIRLVAESEELLNIDTILIDSKAHNDETYATKIGPLPRYEAESTDEVLDFINDNNLARQPLILHVDGSGYYIGIFYLSGPSDNPTYVTCELESLENKKRYYATFVNGTSLTFADLISATYENDNVVEKGSPLPVIEYASTDNVVTFITNNGINAKPVIFKSSSTPSNYYIGMIRYIGSSILAFELEALDSPTRYIGSTSTNASSLTFADILNATYQKDYEIVNNKVTSINSSSTDTEFPSAKCVYDNVQSIRELANGKCSAYVLNYNESAPDGSDLNYYYLDNDGNFVKFENAQEIADWITGKTLKDSDFNSQNNYVSFSWSGLPGANVTDYVIIQAKLPDEQKSVKLCVTLSQLYNMLRIGDVVYVRELNVPDRWVSTISYQAGGGMTPETTISFSKLETSKVDLTSYTEFSDVNNILGDVICGVYSDASTYALNDIVIHDNKLYRCTTAILTAEDWDATHWTATTVADGFVDLYRDQTISGNKTFNGKLNPNTSGYGLTLPDTSSFTANSEIIDSASAQTISGVKTFSNGIYFAVNKYIKLDNNGKINIYFENSPKLLIDSVLQPRQDMIPYENNSFSLGSASYKWKDIYLARNLSDGTNSMSVADIVASTFNVINASDIVSNTLTQDQFDLITNGKPTLIKGTLLGFEDLFVFPTKEDTNSQFWYGLVITSKTNSASQYIANFIINSSKTCAIASNIINITNAGLSGKINSVNGKSLPSYPSSTGTFTLKCDSGTLNWIADGAYDTPSGTELSYVTINNLSLSTDTTLTLATPASSATPEYRANITNSGASSINVTLPSGTKILCNDDAVTISSNVFTLPSGTTVELSLVNLNCVLVNFDAA